jgi:glycosyltransferase involved in cell wall biosynthesis
MGARHNYAIPRMLEKTGHLQALYTDSNGAKGIGAVLRRLPQALTRGKTASLTARLPNGVPLNKIRHTDAVLLHRLGTEFHSTTSVKSRDLIFDRAVATWDFSGANTLYAMQKHGTKLLEAARAHGLRVVVDVFVTPLARNIVQEERQHFPELEKPEVDLTSDEEEDERTRQEIDQADFLLCPGLNVVEGLASFPKAYGKAYAVVPYGCGAVFGDRRNTPIPGRVLFAGTAELRKGIHYLGMAAAQLAGKGYEFRVAGSVSETVRQHPLTRHLTFLGRISRAQMVEEFLQADLMVLPTLAEGCASVVHEAVAAGCPVITTQAAGSLIQNGQGGLLVQQRDADGLATAIDQVVTDRDLRQHLAESCLTLANEMTEDAWCQRLLTALQDPAPARVGS